MEDTGVTHGYSHSPLPYVDAVWWAQANMIWEVKVLLPSLIKWKPPTWGLACASWTEMSHRSRERWTRKREDTWIPVRPLWTRSIPIETTLTRDVSMKQTLIVLKHWVLEYEYLNYYECFCQKRRGQHHIWEEEGLADFHGTSSGVQCREVSCRCSP